MKKLIYTFTLVFLLIFSVSLLAQPVPELIYYKFENNTSTTTPNFASSPVGTNPASYTGNVIGPGGQFDSCMIGTGATGTNGVLTGWNCNLAATQWTIGFWVKDLAEVAAGSPTYLFGDAGSSAFRCFYAGFALPNNLAFRGPFTDIIVSCPMPDPQYIHFVYDGTNILVYRNGVLQSTNPRTVNMPTGSGFRVAGYTGGAFALNSGGKMDEFRLYNRALGAAEIAATWNIELPGGPASCTYGWSAQTSGTTSALRSNSAVSAMVGWAAGAAGTVRRTTDGGTTWGNGNPNPGVITGDIYNIYAWSANDALCTTSPTAAATFVYKTSNGGTNWTQVYTLAGGFINALQMVSPTEGYGQGDPVGGFWVIIKTTDGGNTWARIATEPAQVGTEAGWNNAFYIDGNNIWYNTNVSTVYRSTNLGLNWSSSPLGGVTSTSYGSVHYNSSSLGLASGVGGVARSTDGGATYTSIGAIPGTGNLNAIEGYGNNYFWYVRGTGVFISTNGGTNFVSAFTATSGTFNDMDFSINGCPSGWAVTSTGAIYKMDILTGIQNSSLTIPDSYSLQQNYPNPFNPTTSINYTIPQSGFVTLKVYNSLGKEVATLVNESKIAGNYIVDFNASNLSSGAYFYRIETNNFVDTKKMMLIK